MWDPSTLTLKSGRVLDLPPGRFIEELEFEKTEIEFKRLQDTETRLTAENHEFRKITESWQPGWRTLAVTLLGGIAIGVYITK
jgi:hypothetical protein